MAATNNDCYIGDMDTITLTNEEVVMIASSPHEETIEDNRRGSQKE